MEMRREEQINRLKQALKRTDKLHLKDAAALLGVSEMTDRRDLKRRNGVAGAAGGLYRHCAAQQRSNALFRIELHHVDEKAQAGRLAATLIEPDDTLFFDCGTTKPFIIDAIDDDLAFTAVCYSLNTFSALREEPRCNAILCGGLYHPANATFTPLTPDSLLDDICPTKSFFSAAGLCLQSGATCFHFDELALKQRALAMAQYPILGGRSW
ncbi:MAG: DNA-binding transcriptional repressor DeoR [Sodalis sp. (in: enterobacteria)]|uniref:DNA-binding transcriptional repressor DeoR n=1 Tax=Sodalis sp. (in: enterobacteria) TaxID=1898979 RepID=UPI003F302DE0